MMLSAVRGLCEIADAIEAMGVGMRRSPPGKPVVHGCAIVLASGEVACQYTEDGED